jgi:hypothetical protein
MTVAQFRRLALSMPDAVERSHMGHPDFRVRGKIFASLFSPRDAKDGETVGMVKLTPKQQRAFIEAHPRVFEPVSGGWGVRGATQVRLKRKSNLATLRRAIMTAWRNTAPRQLVEQHGLIDIE